MKSAETQVWTKEGEAKRQAVRQMFAEIAPSYDVLNGLMSGAQHHAWRAEAVRQIELRPGDQVLDLCCGTGDFMIPLRKAVGQEGTVIGADFCLPMLAQTEQRTGAANTVVLGDACQLPFASEAFDAVTVGWGIRNVSDIDLAHREIARVLRPGGRFVSLDMAVPSSRILRTLSRFTFHHVVPILGALFGRTQAYRYLPESTDRFWTRDQLADSMRSAGFSQVRYKDLLLGNICLHIGHKP